MSMWWMDEHISFPLTRNKDETDKQMIRNHIRNLVRVSSKHFITCADVETVKRVFMCGTTHANMKGGETSAN